MQNLLISAVHKCVWRFVLMFMCNFYLILNSCVIVLKLIYKPVCFWNTTFAILHLTILVLQPNFLIKYYLLICAADH